MAAPARTQLAIISNADLSLVWSGGGKYECSHWSTGRTAVAKVSPVPHSHEAQLAISATAAAGDTLVGAVGLRVQRPSDGTANGAVPRRWWPMPGHDVDVWLAPIAVVTVMGVGAGVIVSGLPSGAAGAGVLGLLLLTAALSAVALSRRVRDLRLAVPALVGVGMCGAGLDLQADGPGFIASYVSLMGLALRTPRRVAVLAGVPVVAAISAEETYQSVNPTSTVLTVLFASGLLFVSAAFAAVCLDRRQHAEALLAQEAATSAARQQAAALAEGHPAAGKHETRDGQAGRGRAGEAREDHQR